MQYQFIQDHEKTHGVEVLCECFGLRRSGYYAWRKRGLSARAKEDAELCERIEALHKRSKGRYGHRPIYHHLQEENQNCGRDRTLRLMKEMELSGEQRKRYKPLVTNSKHDFGYSPNLLREQGKPEGLDQVWVADTTYLRTDAGWAYLATVMDLCSRRVIGWSVSSRNDAALVCRALQTAVDYRGGKIGKGLIHHSDRGSTYACEAYQKLLSKHRIKSSMSAKGNCYDNAAMESFYGRYKTSTVRKRVFADENEARSNAFEYIECFYNPYRKHASLGYLSPEQFEKNFAPHGGNAAASLSACVETQ